MSSFVPATIKSGVTIADPTNYTSYPSSTKSNQSALIDSLIDSLAQQVAGTGNLITKNTPQIISASHRFDGDITFNGAISGVSKDDIGLGNCNNTSDDNKPISTATANALNLKAGLINNTFTGLQTHDQYPVISAYSGGPTTNLQLAPKKYIDDNFVSKTSNNTLSGVQNFNNNVIIGDGVGGDVVTINANISANSETITPTQLARINKYNINTNLSTLLDAKVNLSSDNTLTGVQNFNNNLIIGDNVGNDTMTINANIVANSQTITPAQLSRINKYDINTNLSTLLDAKANLAGTNTFTGNNNVPTQAVNNNSTRIASTEYCDRAISNLVSSAPSTLDTLNELATALGSDPNFATTTTNLIATKAGLSLHNTFTDNNTFNISPLLGSTATANVDFTELQYSQLVHYKYITDKVPRLYENNNFVGYNMFDRLPTYNTLYDYTSPAERAFVVRGYTDANYMHKTNNNTVTGNQTFTGGSVQIGNAIDDRLNIIATINANNTDITPTQLARASTRYDVDTNLSTLIDGKADITTVVYSNNWTVNVNVNYLSAVISSIGSTMVQNVMMSAGQHNDIVSPLILSSTNLNISGPVGALSSNITLYNAPITIQGSTIYNVRLSNIQFTQPIIINGTQGKHYFTNCTFTSNFTLQGSTTNFITFYYCTFSAGFTIPITFAGYIICYFCDFQGATLTLNNVSAQQLFINSCVGLPSLSLNATLLGFNNTSSENSVSTNSLNVLGTTTFPNNSIGANSINNTRFVDLTTNQTVAGVKTHSSYPVISSYGSGPTSLQFAPRKYVDDNFVSRTANNTLTGVQNFNNNIIIGDGVGADIVTINANISANSQTITPAQLSRINRYNVDTNLSTLLDAKAGLSTQNTFTAKNNFETTKMQELDLNVNFQTDPNLNSVQWYAGPTSGFISFRDNFDNLLARIKTTASQKEILFCDDQDAIVAKINKTGIPTETTDLITKSYYDSFVVQPSLFIVGNSAKTLTPMNLTSGVVYLNFTDSTKVIQMINFEISYTSVYAAANSLATSTTNPGLYLNSTYSVIYNKSTGVWGTPRHTLLNGNPQTATYNATLTPITFGIRNGRPAIAYQLLGLNGNNLTNNIWISGYQVSIKIVGSIPHNTLTLFGPTGTSTQSDSGNAYFSLT